MKQLLLAAFIAVASAQAAAAQEVYPSRPISLVVPFPPGGVADLTARPVATAMEKVLKQPVGVVNKTGAAGAVGMQFVATSKPDGYTLLLALSSISIIPEADKIFGRPPAFTVDQFAPVALISADPTILANRWETALMKYRISSDYRRDGPPRWEVSEVLHVTPGPDFAAAVSNYVEKAEATLAARTANRQTPTKPCSRVRIPSK